MIKYNIVNSENIHYNKYNQGLSDKDSINEDLSIDGINEDNLSTNEYNNYINNYNKDTTSFKNLINNK